MGNITVRAMKDIWYETSVTLDADKKVKTNGKLYKGPDGPREGQVFTIDEKDFSDWHTATTVKGMTMRGSMERVKSVLIDGVQTWVRDEGKPVEAATAPI